ncbi:MAG: nuclear transport factor 2 family protein [Cyanobacteriota bacterium]|nr:nuclear transport factor 2 family protein [Cyanobacteriota bacterium]
MPNSTGLAWNFGISRSDLRAPFDFPSTRRWLASVLGAVASATVGLSSGFGGLPASAQTPESAPPELQQLLVEIDEAAAEEDVDGVLKFYSDDFIHADGLNRDSLEDVLKQFWERFDNLTYRTELLSWETNEAGEIVAETMTYITGVEILSNREFALEATMRSRQRYSNDRIVYQEILLEESQLTSGEKPPTLDVYLPEQVFPGARYNFDAIVQEPLENDFLIGAAVEQTVSANEYLNVPVIELEALPAGGVYKLGRASSTEGAYWVSALTIRGGGIALVTRRFQVSQE